MKDIISVIIRDTPGLAAKAKPNSRLKAELALLRLRENLERLEKRHNDYVSIEQLLAKEDLDKLNLSLREVQIEFVDKIEAFHQQVYSTISVLVMVLNYIGIVGTKDQHPHRSIQKFLNFLKTSTNFKPELHQWINVLLESVRFRAEFIDHPQGRPAYNWMTSAFNDEVFVVYFESQKGHTRLLLTDDPIALHPRHPDFRPPINTSKYFVSPDRASTYYAMKVLVRVLLYRNDLEPNDL